VADTKDSELSLLAAADIADNDEIQILVVSDTTTPPADASGSNKATLVSSLRSKLALPAAVYNASVVQQSGFSSDTYLAGSGVAIPVSRLQAKTMYRAVFNVVKTNAGVATPIITLRIGTAGTTADAARGVLTFSAQTAVVDEGTFDIWAVFRTVGSGAAAVLQSLGRLTHRLSITGLGVGVSEPEIATSAGFDSTVAGTTIGLSVNGGASAAWTVNFVRAEIENLA
jgi:hypothetical protein